MLRMEPDRRYYVYPSWARLPYRWEDLPDIIADPLGSRLPEDLNERYWRLRDYPIPPQPADLIAGPEGGGIIAAHVCCEPYERWLPSFAFAAHGAARISTPSGMSVFTGSPHARAFHTYVTYIEPRGEPGWELGLARRAKVYLCGATPEHIESDPESVYWAIDWKKAERKLPGLADVAGWAAHFGLKLSRLDAPPQAVSEETAGWFANPDYQQTWFKVQDGGDKSGFHFAIMLYVGLHLRKIAGPRMRSIHLIASIEGKPNVRPIYWRRAR